MILMDMPGMISRFSFRPSHLHCHENGRALSGETG